ncbi:MAG: anhydro-N-acetylmuramic acid kinase, partial [Gammaproteobacteria bacterium]|nr:anhydro-N-acetylmuramic acid kinase [Gammaproteobacteria bacterium]
MLSIGLMSGTSMDGIDAALIRTDGYHDITELGQLYIAYHPAFKILLKAAEYAIKTTAEIQITQGNYSEALILAMAETAFDQLLKEYLTHELNLKDAEFSDSFAALLSYFHDHINAKLSISLAGIIDHSTDLHGQAVEQLLIQTAHKATQIDVVGCHGQTFFHRPTVKLSIVLCHGERLAEQLKISVVTDFRRCDVDAGGQGAPLAPLYHQALAKHDHKIPCAVVNCGGIANITVISNEHIKDHFLNLLSVFLATRNSRAHGE